MHTVTKAVTIAATFADPGLKAIDWAAVILDAVPLPGADQHTAPALDSLQLQGSMHVCFAARAFSTGQENVQTLLIGAAGELWQQIL